MAIEKEKNALVKPRPTISLAFSKFNGPPNRKKRETDILAMLSKRASLPVIQTTTTSLHATADSQSEQISQTPITVVK